MWKSAKLPVDCYNLGQPVFGKKHKSGDRPGPQLKRRVCYHGDRAQLKYRNQASRTPSWQAEKESYFRRTIAQAADCAWTGVSSLQANNAGKQLEAQPGQTARFSCSCHRCRRAAKRHLSSRARIEGNYDRRWPALLANYASHL